MEGTSISALRPRGAAPPIEITLAGMIDLQATPQHTGIRLTKLVLEDANEKIIEIALWEEIANGIDKETLINAPFPCIVVLTAMMVVKFKNLQLTSTATTHLCKNPDFQAASDLANNFRERYAGINMDD